MRRVDSGSCVTCAKKRRKKVYHEAKADRPDGILYKSFCLLCDSETDHYCSNGNCKVCANKRSITHYQDNRDFYLQSFRLKYHENKEQRNAQGRAWYEKNKQELKLYYSAYREQNKEKIKKWRSSESAMRKHRERQKERYSKPNGKAEMSIRNMVYRILKGASCGKAVSLVGYLPSDLVSHIESKFEHDMSWDNYGEWHIDHIVPVSVFIKNGVTDPSIINALINLQPMWASDNIAKLDRFDGVFEDELKIIKESLC